MRSSGKRTVLMAFASGQRACRRTLTASSFVRRRVCLVDKGSRSSATYPVVFYVILVSRRVRASQRGTARSRVSATISIDLTEDFIPFQGFFLGTFDDGALAPRLFIGVTFACVGSLY